MNKIKELVEKNINVIISFTVGLIIAGGICVIGTTIMASNEISYDNSES